MVTVDDLDVAQLTDEPACDLFPVLNRSGVMMPLIVLLGVLSGLYAFQHHTTDESDISWGLRSLALLPEANVAGVIDDDSRTSDAQFRFHPPLGTWLIAISQFGLGSSERLSLILPAYLSTVALIIMTYVFLRVVAGPRIGFLAAVLLTCHGHTFQQANDPSMQSLGVLFALIAFWGYFGHMRSAFDLVSIPLVVGGISLGLCLLAAGTQSLAVIAIILMTVLRFTKKSNGRKIEPATQRIRGSSGFPAFRSLFILTLLAFAMGGWWELRRAEEHGLGFWYEWIFGLNIAANQITFALPGSNLLETVQLIIKPLFATTGIYLALSAVGGWLVVRDLFSETTDVVQRQWLRFLMAWTILSCTLWLLVMPAVPHAAHALNLWKSFAVVPLVILAAIGLDGIIQMRVTVAGTASTTFLTILLLIGTVQTSLFEAVGQTSLIWLLLFLLTTLVLVTWSTTQYCHQNEWRHHRVLEGCAVALTILIFVPGFVSMSPRSLDDRELELFSRQLADVPNVDTVVLVTELKPHPRLLYALKTLWLKAPLISLRRWEDVPAFLARKQDFGGASQQPVIVTWGIRTVPLIGAKQIGFQLSPFKEPRFFGERLLRAFRAESSQKQDSI